MLKSNKEIELASDFLTKTGAHIFLTGRAGTGKTTFLRNILLSINKRAVVTAPTGVAAINAHGVTLHSLFQIPFGPNIPLASSHNSGLAIRKMNRTKRALIRSIELLVIDEISMVRSDTLDSVDQVLREVRRNDKPFGGVQLLMIGDVQQLTPICHDDEWEILREHYQSIYFFDSKALRSCNYITIELQEIFRQKEPHFTSLLNAVRENKITNEVIEQLNSRYIPDFKPQQNDGYITLTTHNNTANEINTRNLNNIKHESYFYKAKIEGEYPRWSYPNDETLEFKLGAQVIFIKNDISPQRLYYNGMTATITDISESVITVETLNEKRKILIAPINWENIEYTLNKDSGAIEENIKGIYTQIPLRLAWAITIHKSQGLTFEKAVIDAGHSFAFGQVYVALSRCRSFEGLVLSSPIKPHSIFRDRTVEGFSTYIQNNQPQDSDLQQHQKGYFYSVLSEIFNYKPLSRQLLHISNLVYGSLLTQYPLLCNKISDLAFLADKDLSAVGKTFSLQLNHIIENSKEYQNDSFLKERLQSAAQYFATKVQNIREVTSELALLPIDEKELQKRLTKLLEEFTELLTIKEIANELCRTNYSTQEYLKRKFKVITASANKSKDKKQNNKGEEKTNSTNIEATSDIVNPELLDILRSWRLEQARSEEVAAYRILTNKSIIEMQAKLPNTPKKLAKISGIGKVKLEQYGDELIEIISNYLNDMQFK